MTCSSCGHDISDSAKFCKECGAAVARRCAKCSSELRPAAKFCEECGTAVATAALDDAAGARKIVTIVFADLVGSTALHERLDAESARLLMERYYAVLRAAVDAHGGTVVKLLGDGVMVAFGVRQIAEDDAIRAVRAAVAMQDAFRELRLEQAYLHLRELGPVDSAGRALGDRASSHLAAAGRLALARDDLSLAAGLLGRALELLDAAAPTRADLALDWCEALLAAGDVTRAAGAIDELGRLVEGSERLRAWHVCFAGQYAVMTVPEDLSAAVEVVAAAAASLATLDDAAGEAKGHFVHALVLSRLGRVGACEASLDQALAAARRANDRRCANTVLAVAPLAALWGPSPVTRASGRCLDVVRVLRITEGAPAVEAVALSCQGVLEALRGRTDAAHRMIASGREMVKELGIAQRLFEADVFAGYVALLEGDVASAERTLHGAYDGLRDLGLGIDAARAAALLARALLAQDRIEDAEALSHESEALAGDDLKAAIAWRGVRAEALAQRGEHAKAIEFARAAVAIAAATDALLDHADARLALAAALRAAGRGAEAEAEEQQAVDLWDAKGATLLAERERRDRVSVRAAGTTPESPPGKGGAAEAVRRRIRPNAASRLLLAIEAGFAARDRIAIEALLGDPLHTVEHPTGASYGRAGQLESIERMLRLPNVEFCMEVLATLGETLSLGRRRVTGRGTAGGRFDVAEYEMDHIVLAETDEHGRLRLSEVFAADHLGDAVARLYERCAELLSDGPARDCATTTAYAVAYMVTQSRDHRGEDVMAPDLQAVDHRTVGHELVGQYSSRWEESWGELAGELTFHIDEVLALSSQGLLRRTNASGLWRATGGAFETSSYAVSVFGPDGRQERGEFFDIGKEAEALACFDELTKGGGSSPPFAGVAEFFANAAVRAVERGAAALAARDWEAFCAVFADDFRNFDRRAMFRVEADRDQWLTAFRAIVEMTSAPPVTTVIATRGDRLVLVRMLWQGAAGDVGPSEIHWLLIIEVDDRGEWRSSRETLR